MTERGKFIVFEGIDGCGKDTQMLLSVPYLYEKSKFIDLYVTREPTRHSKEIRKRLESSTDVSQNREFFVTAFMDDRSMHQSPIEGMLAFGTHVLTVRYQSSTDTFQPLTGISFERIRMMHDEREIISPDLTLIYDLPAPVAFARRQAAGATDVFDKDLAFQEKLRIAYLELPGKLPKEKFKIIDANRPIEQVFEDTKKTLDDLFGF